MKKLTNYYENPQISKKGKYGHNFSNLPKLHIFIKNHGFYPLKIGVLFCQNYSSKITHFESRVITSDKFYTKWWNLLFKIDELYTVIVIHTSCVFGTPSRFHSFSIKTTHSFDTWYMNWIKYYLHDYMNNIIKSHTNKACKHFNP